MTAPTPQEISRTKLNLETSKIAWKELQTHFASGNVLFVAADMDLIEAALQLSEDNTAQIRQWLDAGKFGKASDAQASEWYNADALMWAVVVSPWVLVQQIH